MKIEFTDNPALENEDTEVDTDTNIKKYLVEYVGQAKNPDDGNITVGMIVDVVAEEFPEFVMALAEENWIRGYQQALTDVSVGEKLKREEDESRQHNKA